MRLEQHDIVTLDEAESVDSLTKKLGDLLVNQKLRLTSAESCPGGNWRQHCAQQKIRPHFTVWGMSPLLMKPKQNLTRTTPQSCRTYRRQRSGCY